MPQLLIRGLRQQLKAFHRWPLGAASFGLLLRLVLYATAFAGTLVVSSFVLRALLGVAAGVFSGSLFMIGHDACHGSYTSRPVLNQVIGRIAFLSSYHTYSPWELSHNRIHHVYTNLRDKDFVWTPLSRAELDALPWWKRRLYRAYRTPLGLALYYPIEIWWPRLFFPRRALLDRPRRVYTLDSLLVLGFLAAQLAMVAAASAGWHAWALGTVFALVVPYLTFSWMIGFVIYFNHTHPEVPWFAARGEWSSAAGALRGTVRLTFPRWTAFFAPSIMDHVAHHVDPRVPLVRLKQAQERIEAVLPGQIVVQAWSVRALLGILERCKLYDYDAHCWTDFQGSPTTRRLAPGLPHLEQAAAWRGGTPAQHAS
ncbi:MAG TPA: fatty acid desaturase [Kofleriaceae bacterium]|nr:fatty acid desaturase [Kofleriaceae bacterium]